MQFRKNRALQKDGYKQAMYRDSLSAEKKESSRDFLNRFGRFFLLIGVSVRFLASSSKTFFSLQPHYLLKQYWKY
jgi:hypothetical protein